MQPTLGASDEVAVVVGLRSCAGIAEPWTCDGVDPTHDVGTVLFKGPFSPQVQAGTGRSDLVQTVTVEVPSSFPKGAALLSVVHLALVVSAVLWNQREVIERVAELVHKANNPFLEVVHNTVFVE